jgi:CHAT domain-containing protein
MTIPPHIDRVFRALYPIALGDTGDLRRRVAADASLRSLEIADTADEVAKDAALSRNVEGTFVFATIACVIYEALDLPEKALHALLPNVSIGFVQAETADDYMRVANSAGRKAAQAEALGAPGLGMKYRILLADCLYFAARLEGSDVDRLHRVAIEALTETFKTPGATSLGAPWTSRARSLIANLYHLHSQRLAAADDAAPLGRLAALTEALIPIQPPAEPGEHFVAHAAWLAELSYRYGDSSIAEDRVQAAAPLATSPDEKWLLRTVRYAGLRGRSSTSLAPLRSSIRELSELRRTAARSRAGRLFARQQDSRTEGMLFDDQATDPSATDADLFAESDRLKARLLLDELAARGKPISAAVTSKVAALEAATFALNRLNSATPELLENLLISQLSIGSPFGPEERAEYVTQIEAIYESADAGIGVASTCTLAQAQQALGADEALLEYAIPYFPGHPAPRVVAFAVTRNAVIRRLISVDGSSFRGPIMRMAVDGASAIDASPLGDAVIACRRAIKGVRDEDARRHLAFLHQTLLQPLIDSGFDPARFQRLIVVPHGPLHYVPFGALAPQDGRFLIEEVPITVAPSASSWLHLATRSRSVAGATSFLGVANPVLGDPALPPLPETVKELEKILAALPGLASQRFVGAEAIESDVCRSLSGKSIIHFATHGEFPELNALDDHRILLGPGKGSDGKLHARELRQIDLSAARLVVLNICNGGLYRVGPGDEPYGLVAALLAAGAENVLGTLWEMEDTSARTFITQFYKAHLDRGIANAVRAASVRTLSIGGKLHQWAGFVNVGPGRAIDLAS